MEILDCTLRDGMHALATPLTPEQASRVIGGLTRAGVKVIEAGKPSGLGSPHAQISDEAYMQAMLPWQDSASVGMFCTPKFATDELLELAARYRLGFLRIGSTPQNVDGAEEVIKKVRNLGIFVRFSLMRVYAVSASQAAECVARVADMGADAVTLMDSAGTMLPRQVVEYVDKCSHACNIPVGFHGHDNLGLSMANALAAIEAGAQSLDGALTGLARSAGNAPTEMLCALLERIGTPIGVELPTLLDFVDGELKELFQSGRGVKVIDLLFGLSGFHSGSLKIATQLAERYSIPMQSLFLGMVEKGAESYSEADMEDLASSIAASGPVGHC